MTAFETVGRQSGKPQLLSSSVDATVRLWNLDSLWQPSASTAQEPQLRRTFKHHQDAVRGISVHPTELFFASASEDGSWCLNDLETEAALVRVRNHDEGEAEKGNLSVQFHPDGSLLAVGSEQSLAVWDLRANHRPVSVLGQPLPNQRYTCLAFSDNGYHLASGQSNGRLVLWDLRKSGIIRSVAQPAAISAVAIDPSARCLAASYGSTISLYRLSSKQCRDLSVLSGHVDQIVALNFVKDPSVPSHSDPFLISTASDSTVRIFANPTKL